MHIDVYHDTVCPWCRVGKQHLRLALANWSQEPVTIQYRAFFLNPGIPPEGAPFREYMNAKVNGAIPLEQMFEGPRAAGEKVGLRFNFEAITHAPNSINSHRLIAMTPEPQREAMIDAIYAAYFEQGQNIGELDTLAEIASRLGLDADAIRARLLTDESRAQVLAEADQALRSGVSGVPFFVLNGRYAFSGAHPPHVITQILQQAVVLSA